MSMRRQFLLLLTALLLLTSCSKITSNPANDGTIRDLPLPGASISVASGTVSSTDSTVSMGYDTLRETKCDGLSVLEGQLAPNIRVDAFVLTDRDTSDPGTASVDRCEKFFFPVDQSDKLLSDTDTVLSDESKNYYVYGEIMENRYLFYKDMNNRICKIYNVRSDISVLCGEYFDDAELVPDRFPASDDDYPWGTDDFTFATRETAVNVMKDLCEKAGIPVSPVMQITLLTPEALEMGQRVQIASGNNIAERNFGEDDGIYRIEGSIDWDGLPCSRDGNGELYQLQLPGETEAYYLPDNQQVDFSFSKDGVLFFHATSSYTLVTRGEQEKLISLKEAMNVLKEELPQTTDNSSYEIGKITLCTMPFYTTPLDPKDFYGNLEESQNDTDNIELSNQLFLLPCWEFSTEESVAGTGMTTKNVLLVNAITGEYLHQYTEVSS